MTIGTDVETKFERGSISYMLTATLTRPIAIAPTMSCERKITLAESIDIAGLGKPKARVITLKPIRRTKPRAQVKLSMAYAHKAKEPAAGPQPFHRSSPSTQGRPADPPLSPAPSAVSSASVVSSDASVPAASELAQPDRGFSDEQNNGEDRPDGTISVTIEILRGACLPGDSIPLVISIAHTKVIKSVQGIIITLYRLGRVDRQPIVPIGLSMKGKGPADEEYYPRSRTGLGGLSLSSADSTHAFRMDLAQTFAPLLIDPATLTATVNTSIQVPDDVFPTISCTPGAMITFKYFVEVVVDIRGKLAGYDRFFPRITMTGTPSGYGHPRVPNQPTAVRQHVAMTTEPMVDAEQIRRDKSVISCLFEVVVGTKDSRRKVVKQKPGLWEDGTQLEEGDPDSREFDGRYANEESMIGGDADTYEPLQYDYHDESWEDRMTTRGPVLIRPPRLEEAHDEKARVRMAEERLLPSAPPDGDDGSSSACPTGCLPSAPTLNDIQEEYRQDGPSAPAYPGHGTVLDDTTAPGSTGFAYLGNTEPSAQPTFHCCDDKQELERQRLLAAASAPPDSDIDDDEEAGQSGPPRVSVPTAPVLDHNGAYDPAHSATDGQMPLSET
jgi:hypothetical protein